MHHSSSRQSSKKPYASMFRYSERAGMIVIKRPEFQRLLKRVARRQRPEITFTSAGVWVLQTVAEFCLDRYIEGDNRVPSARLPAIRRHLAFARRIRGDRP